MNITHTLNRPNAMRPRILFGLTAALLAATPATAQLPQASAAGLGLGDNYTAVARGFSAVFWNPANLALSGNPRGSFALLGVGGVTGLGPVTLTDVAQYDGQFISDEIKREWLERVREAGGEEGSAGFDLTLLALSIGPLGFQFGTSMRTVGNLAPDAVELALFGNAGLTGDPRPFVIQGSTMDLTATSTGALSYAVPIQLAPESRLAIGATAKYTVGHAVFTGRDLGTRISSEPLELDVRFPMLHNDTVADFDVGRGWGLDVGASWEQKNWSAGVTVRNLVNTFAWDASKLVYSPGTAGFRSDTTDSDFDLRPASQAPQELRERLDELTPSPVLSAGLAYRPVPQFMLSVDLRSATGDSPLAGPKSHLGVGTEVRVVPFLPLRAGAAVIPGGYKLSGGLGLELGGLNLTAGGSVRSDEFGSGGSAVILMSFGAR